MEIGWNGSGMVEVEWNGMEVEQEVIWKGKWNGGGGGSGMEWNGMASVLTNSDIICTYGVCV